MPDSSAQTSLAQRMALAFEKLGFFIFDKELDEAGEVFSVLRRAGIEHAVDVRPVARGTEIYIVEPKERGCRRLCHYERGCGGDKECLESCLAECLAELRRKLAEALRRDAGRGGS